MVLYEPGAYPVETGALEVKAPFTEYDDTLAWGEVSFPHQCDQWSVAQGPRELVLTAIDNLISDLTDARRRVETWER